MKVIVCQIGQAGVREKCEGLCHWEEHGVPMRRLVHSLGNSVISKIIIQAALRHARDTLGVVVLSVQSP
jgi:hypothetical protein